MKKTKGKPIYFIVGAGRSGSTLLQLLIDAHPNTIAPIESRFIIFLYAKYASVKKWNKKRLTQLYKDLFLDEKIYYLWELNKAQLKREILEQPEDTSFGNLCKLVFENYISFFKKEEAKIIVDKNPINSLFVPWLLKVFPTAKFIHLVRDPRASGLSHKKAGMQPNYQAAALMWRDYNEAIEKTKSQLPNRFYTLKYEDLVQNPTAVLEKVNQFLGIDFNKRMLNFNAHLKSDFIERLKTEKTAENKLKLELFEKHHQNLQKPINADSIDLWKKGLNQADIETIEKICVELMEKYNYQPVNKELLGQQKSSFAPPMHHLKKFIIKFYYAAPLWLRVFYSQKINSSLKPKLFFSIADSKK